MNIQHSSRTDCWYTPLDILERVRRVIGPIEFDPASDRFGNMRVGAKTYFSKTSQSDGLSLGWPEGTNIFCNPPGGKRGNQSMTALFWARLMSYRPVIKEAIFLCFSAEALQNTQGKGVPSICRFPFCVPKRRIRFVNEQGEGASPSHSNVIVYVPGSLNNTVQFESTFADLGDVVRPY